MSTKFKDPISGQVCLITGGAQGVGWETAKMLAGRGAQVYVCDISEENINSAKLELKNSQLIDKININISLYDVSDYLSVDKWIMDIYNTCGKIDVIIHNANLIYWSNIDDIPIEIAEKMMQVGYGGALYISKIVLPIMKKAGQGHIIIIGSSAGKVFLGELPVCYSAVKSALNGYTQMLQYELRNSPINISLMRPGIIEGTQFFSKDSSSSKRMPRLADFMPSLTPPRVASEIVKIILNKKSIVRDLPRYLIVFYIFFELFPKFLGFVLRIGGNAKTDFGKIN